MAKTKRPVNEEDLEQELPEEEELRDDENVEEEDEEEEDQVEEETEAASTLHPNARPLADPKSKIEVMKAVIGAVASAQGEDLGYWEKALAAVPKDGAGVPAGNAAHNKSTIDAKPSDAVRESVREDLKVLFDADKTLSEEARERLEIIFEAAVTARVLIEREEMEENMTEAMGAEIQEVREEIESQLTSYLQYCTETWLEENKVAIESSLRSELTEEFMEGLRNLFTEHFIEIPESKSDVIEALTEKVEELESVLNQVIDENNDLKGINTEAELINAIEEVAEGMSVAQTEKLATLAEGIEFDGDIDSFKKKVGIIKEEYFKGNGAKSPEREEDDFERASGELNEDAKVIADPVMRKYAEKISQTMKSDLLVK